MPCALIIDDEKSIRSALREILEYEKFDVEEAPEGSTGLSMLKKNDYDIVFCDIKMPRMDGMEVLDKVLKMKPDVPVVMISGHGTVDTVVEAIKKGAFDFIEKPPDLNRLLVTVRNALDRSSLVEETKVLKEKISSEKGHDMLGESKPFKGIKELICRVAPTEARVLITGANGTGKELVAREIHRQSKRASGPFIEVNCAAIPSELIESELFGHEKGAFTSAIRLRQGKFEQADKGTLFLDEVGDMSLSAQAKVLRALQENMITRVGGDGQIKVNVRILAATNKDLKQQIRDGHFREDLYHRLSVILIQVPSLSERSEDIPLLAEHFIRTLCNEQGIPLKKISDKAIVALKSLRWTGNIREFRNVIERLIILCDKDISDKDVKAFATGVQVPT